MADQTGKPREWLIIVVTGLTGCGGLYLMLACLGVMPMPSKLNGPLWVGAAAGFCFMAAGFGVCARALAGQDLSNGDLPADAPKWLRIFYALLAVALAAALASIGTWIAFGAGPRHFNITGFFSGPVNEIVGRSMFGFGAILSWLIVIAFAYAAWRKMRETPR